MRVTLLARQYPTARIWRDPCAGLLLVYGTCKILILQVSTVPNVRPCCPTTAPVTRKPRGC